MRRVRRRTNILLFLPLVIVAAWLVMGLLAYYAMPGAH